jgi:exodeoxyribonuclease VII small subunit
VAERPQTHLTMPDPAFVGPQPEPESYESAVAELERLVGAMESGRMPLDQLLEGYHRGALLLSFCRERLKAVEDQVRVLENGQFNTLESP